MYSNVTSTHPTPSFMAGACGAGTPCTGAGTGACGAWCAWCAWDPGSASGPGGCSSCHSSPAKEGSPRRTRIIPVMWYQRMAPPVQADQAAWEPGRCWRCLMNLPLVMTFTQRTGNSPCFSWKNSRFQWPCSIAMLNYQRVPRNESPEVVAKRKLEGTCPACTDVSCSYEWPMRGNIVPRDWMKLHPNW